MQFVYNDGGRSQTYLAGTKCRDCVVRAVAIAAELPYLEVFEALSDGCKMERLTTGTRKTNAANGVHTGRVWFKRYMAELGWAWTPTMQIGQGCRVHLVEGELPMGRLIVSVSRHMVAVIDGVIHDTGDPQRETHVCERDYGQALKPGEWRNANGVWHIARRCVYGYWRKP